MIERMYEQELIRLSKHHGAMECLKEVMSDMQDFLNSEENLTRDEVKMWYLIFDLMIGRFEEKSQVINEFNNVHGNENNIVFIGGFK